jgi:hypothetical protein
LQLTSSEIRSRAVGWSALVGRSRARSPGEKLWPLVGKELWQRARREEQDALAIERGGGRVELRLPAGKELSGALAGEE